MLRCVILFVLCLGLAAAGAGKRKNVKQIVKRQTGSCGENQFQCHNGNCIQSEWTCDTDNDCGDHSDETLPECPPEGQCTGKHEVLCDNQQCVPLEFRCDGDDDCGDGTDERGCPDFECTDGEWHCQNGLCIEHDWLCDGDNDCNDGSDELPQTCHGQAP